MRTGENPNKPVQDGFKMHLLCIGCEQKFSALERKFALEIFHPANKNLAHQVTYGDWYCKFCVSVSWRVLNAQMRDELYKKHSEFNKNRADVVNETWKNFLLGRQNEISEFKQHALVFDPITDYYDPKSPPNNLNSFLQRNIEFDLIGWGDEIFMTYAKFGRFMIFGFINSPQGHVWKGTEVEVLRGEFGPVQYHYPQYIIDFYSDQAREMLEIQKGMSEQQKKKNYITYLKNPDIYHQSQAYEATVRDFFLFGRRAPRKNKF